MSWKAVAIILILAGSIAVGLLPAARSQARMLAADFLYPFSYPAFWMTRTLSDDNVSGRSKGELADANEKLRRKLVELELRNDMLCALQRENSELRALHSIRSTPGRNLLFASVFQRDPAHWNLRFTIDKGEESGVQPGDLVLGQSEADLEGDVAGFAVLGRVSEVSKHTSKVVTVDSENFKIACVIDKTGVLGTVCGGFYYDGHPALAIKYLRPGHTHAVGDMVSTAGVGPEVPSGFPLARVVSVDDGVVGGDAQVGTSLLAEPLVDPSRIMNVLVLTRGK